MRLQLLLEISTVIDAAKCRPIHLDGHASVGVLIVTRSIQPLRASLHCDSWQGKTQKTIDEAISIQ
jgi:hypothetical protein